MPRRKNPGQYEAELDKPGHVPGEYLDDLTPYAGVAPEDVPLGTDEEPADADVSPEPENDTVEEPDA